MRGIGLRKLASNSRVMAENHKLMGDVFSAVVSSNCLDTVRTLELNHSLKLLDFGQGFRFLLEKENPHKSAKVVND